MRITFLFFSLTFIEMDWSWRDWISILILPRSAWNVLSIFSIMSRTVSQVWSSLCSSAILGACLISLRKSKSLEKKEKIVEMGEVQKLTVFHWGIFDFSKIFLNLSSVLAKLNSLFRRRGIRERRNERLQRKPIQLHLLKRLLDKIMLEIFLDTL